MAAKITAIIIGVLISVFSSGGRGEDPENLHHNHERIKRQLSPGAASCLHIYTVPQQSTVCYPSEEVRKGLSDLNEAVGTQSGELKNLEKRLDTIDPDKPKEIPEEVKQKLEELTSIKTQQAGHEEKLSHLQSEIQHVNDRVKSVESTDRLELARLIEQQSNLIQVAMAHSNKSLHTEYVNKLSASTDDLTNRLLKLETDMRTEIQTSKTQIQDQINQVKSDRQHHVQEVKEHLSQRMDTMEDSIKKEAEHRMKFQDQAIQNGQQVAALKVQMSHVQDTQTTLANQEAQLKSRIDELEKRLILEVEEKYRLSNKSGELEKSLGSVKAGYERLQGLVSGLLSQAQDLRFDIEELNAVVLNNSRAKELLPKVTDCQTALHFYEPINGVYTITPFLSDKSQHFKAFCEMDAGKEEGWTVIMRRNEGKEEFYRLWDDYKMGFGDLNKEHWLGLENIHKLTKKRNMKIRIDMEDWDARWFYAEYTTFYLEGEDHQYKLHVDGYSGDAGDSLSYHDGMMFSTLDRNNDMNDAICATWCHGAWWYKDCYQSNLNGRYYTGGAYTTSRGWGDGMVWRTLRKTNYYSLKSVVMKVIPQHSTKKKKVPTSSLR